MTDEELIRRVGIVKLRCCQVITRQRGRRESLRLVLMRRWPSL
jgi:hypothetical protein